MTADCKRQVILSVHPVIGVRTAAIARGHQKWFNAVPNQECVAQVARCSGADRLGTRRSQALPPTLVVAAQQSGG